MIGKLRIMNGANKGFQSIGEILAESFSGLSEAWLPELSELLSDGFAVRRQADAKKAPEE